MNTELELIDVRRLVKGVGFIKSRKAAPAVLNMAEDMDTFALQKKAVNLVTIIVDETAGMDVDRKPIDVLMEWMEKDEIEVVFVRDIMELTDDMADLFQFLRNAERLGVSVYDMKAGCNRIIGTFCGD